MFKRFIAMTSLATMAAFVVGCGGGSDIKTIPTQEVTGKITFQGKTIDGATVTFIPEGKHSGASGTSDAQGIYKLRTDGRFEGAMEGSYKVTVVKVETIGKIPESTDDPNYGKDVKVKTNYIVPQKYSDPAKSGLTATVKTGKNDIPFDLK